MSILRRDPISGGWVIIAGERAFRPTDFQPAELPAGLREECPFCHGNESMTPPEIRAGRPDGSAPNTRGWTWRVIPNKFAAMRIEGELNPVHAGIFEAMNGIGAHEVIIETARHPGRLAEFSRAKLEETFRIYRERTIDLHRDPRFRYVQIFRNYGSLAGASLEHPHSQLIALPIAPRRITEELLRAREHLLADNRCIFCQLLHDEALAGDRVVAQNEMFIAFAPYAARFPFETWVFPKLHSHDFQFATDAQLPALAELMRRVLWSLQLALNDPPFNYFIHSAPERLDGPAPGNHITEAYHWHIEIIPRVTKAAGFEYGTGFYINPTLPETAAARMRDVLRKSPEPPELVTS